MRQGVRVADRSVRSSTWTNCAGCSPGPTRRRPLLDVRWALATGSDPAATATGTCQEPASSSSTPSSPRPGGGGRHPLPGSRRRSSESMRRAGVGRRTHLWCVTTPARARRPPAPGGCCACHGHRQVFVLDGGLAAWQAAGRPIETGDPRRPRRATSSRGEATVDVLDVADVLDAAQDGMLLDARAEERYLGLTEPVDPGRRTHPRCGQRADDGERRTGRALPACRPLRARFADARRRRQPSGRRVLRLRRHGRARGARSRGRRSPRGAVPGLVVALDHRSRPARWHAATSS